MRRKLQTLLFALVAMMMPIGAWAQLQKIVKLDSGVATLYLPIDMMLSDTNTKAYVVTDVIIKEDGSVQLVEEELPDGKIPALTAVIIRNEIQAQEVTLNVITEGLEPFITKEANLLKGVLVPTAMDVSPETGNFVLSWDVSADSKWPYITATDWQAHPDDNRSWTYTLGANKAYLDLSGKLEPSKIAELKTLPHLQHTHGGCEICGQVTEVSWGTSADDLTSYGTLADAFAAAAEENSTVGYIQLQVDVENGVVIDGGTFTLDLNGHTIGVYGLQIQGADTHVTLKGETEGSVVFANNESSPAVNVIDGASVTIESGTYTNDYNIAVNNETDCSVTIIDGVFESTRTNAIENKGDLVIKGGTFTTSDDLSTISYSNGSINLSEYENITDISIGSWIYPSFIPSAETILLPEGYCFFDSEGIPVTVLVGGGTYYIADEPAKYAITFEANGGEGEMEDVIVYEGDYTLPECAFTVPEGMMFKAWQIGEDEYQPGDVVTIEDNTIITALWTDNGPQIVINMSDIGEGWNDASITVKKDGEQVGTATVDEGFDTNTVRFTYDPACEYTFYWTKGECDYECSFEIIVNGEKVFEALQYESEEGLVSDCEDFTTEDPFFTLKAEAKWGTSADAETFTYGTLDNAFAAAAEENSTVGYIQLQKDVETCVYINGGNFTLDLNGHKITSEEHTLDIRNSNVTIVDNSENGEGKVIATDDGYYAVFVSNNALVTFNGGSYESLHNVVKIESGSTVTIEGGEFTSINSGVIETSGNLTIKGGGYQTGEGIIEVITYCKGTMTFEAYDGICGITIYNSGADITPGSEIILPEGYCFYDYFEDLPVEVLLSGGLYLIQKEPENTLSPLMLMAVMAQWMLPLPMAIISCPSAASPLSRA